jgi:hypothetical protein
MDLPIRLILFAADDLTAISPNVAYTAGQGSAKAVFFAAAHSVQDYCRDFFPFVFR